MLRALPLAMTFLLLPWGYSSADTPIGLGENAALKYWQAFSQMPKFTDAEEQKFKQEFQTMPLDAHAREIVTKAGCALRMMHRGAGLPRCDWSLGYEEGLGTPLAHTSAALSLARLACLSARIRFEDGYNAYAIDDIVDTMTLGRHLSMDGCPISGSTGSAIGSLAGVTLAAYLPKLNTEEIKCLKRRLSALPPFLTPAQALVTFEEKCLLDWYIREIKEKKDKEGVVYFLGWSMFSEVGDTQKQRRERACAFLERCGGTADSVVKLMEEIRPCYALAAKMMELPVDQCAQEFGLEARKQAGNPVFKVLFPDIASLRRNQAAGDLYRAFLATALDIQLDGPDALKNHPDPVVGGPFEFVAFEGGFKLRSKFVRKPDKPSYRMELIVGKPGK